MSSAPITAAVISQGTIEIIEQGCMIVEAKGSCSEQPQVRELVNDFRRHQDRELWIQALPLCFRSSRGRYDGGGCFMICSRHM